MTNLLNLVAVDILMYYFYDVKRVQQLNNLNIVAISRWMTNGRRFPSTAKLLIVMDPSVFLYGI